jgi:hypothetical protein
MIEFHNEPLERAAAVDTRALSKGPQEIGLLRPSASPFLTTALLFVRPSDSSPRERDWSDGSRHEGGIGSSAMAVGADDIALRDLRE